MKTTTLPPFEIIDDEMVQVLRAMTPVQRLKMVSSMWDTARVLLRAAIRTEHPDWDLAAVNREIARRISNGATDDVGA